MNINISQGMRVFRHLAPQSTTNEPKYNSTLPTTPGTINGNSVQGFRLRLRSETRRAQHNSFSLEVEEKHSSSKFKNACNLRRRISTAGASNRFPKDFFSSQFRQSTKNNEYPSLKWEKIAADKPRYPLFMRRKQESTNLQIQPNCAVGTPKFNGQGMDKENEQRNQFIDRLTSVPVSCFPSLQELKIEDEPVKPRASFVKRVKKGQILKRRFQQIRNNALTKGQSSLSQINLN